MALGEREAEADVAVEPPQPDHFYSLLAQMPDGGQVHGGYGALPGVGPEDIIDEFADRGITVLWMIETPMPELPKMQINNHNN